MKVKQLAAAALCALSAPVFAQSSVTLYGILDTGIEYVSYASANGAHWRFSGHARKLAPVQTDRSRGTTSAENMWA